MSYQFNSIVNRNEAEALKEMIFRRAREREKSMTDDVQADIMDLAHASFVSNNNPFSKIVNTEIEQTQSKAIVEQSEEQKEAVQNRDSEIGFTVSNKPQIAQTMAANEVLIKTTVENNMRDAREELVKRESFMGALNFLNSQAAISLIKTRSDKFEMVV